MGLKSSLGYDYDIPFLSMYIDFNLMRMLNFDALPFRRQVPRPATKDGACCSLADYISLTLFSSDLFEADAYLSSLHSSRNPRMNSHLLPFPYNQSQPPTLLERVTVQNMVLLQSVLVA